MIKKSTLDLCTLLFITTEKYIDTIEPNERSVHVAGSKSNDIIDHKLRDAGWTIQDMKQFSPLASCGVAVREFPAASGPADYTLFA